MTIELTPQTIITAGAVLSAALAIGTAVAKFVRWIDQQKKQTLCGTKNKRQTEIGLRGIRDVIVVVGNVLFHDR